VQGLRDYLHQNEREIPQARAIVLFAPHGGPVGYRDCRFSCRLNSGEEFALQVLVDYAGVTEREVKHRVYCELPAVPESCRGYEIILRQRQRQRRVAHWRIVNPPQLRHNLIAVTKRPEMEVWPGMKVHAVCSGDNIRLAVENAASSSGVRPAKGIGAWAFRNVAAKFEWENPNRTPTIREGTPSDVLDGPAASETSLGLTDVPPTNGIRQRVIVTGILDRYAQRSEVVTFRNLPMVRCRNFWRIAAVPALLRKTTSDGVTVSVVPWNPLKWGEPDGYRGDPIRSEAAYDVSVTPFGKVTSLARCRLCRRPADAVLVRASLKGGAASDSEVSVFGDGTSSGSASGILRVRRLANGKFGGDITVTVTETVLERSAPFACCVEPEPNDADSFGIAFPQPGVYLRYWR